MGFKSQIGSRTPYGPKGPSEGVSTLADRLQLPISICSVVSWSLAEEFSVDKVSME